MQKDNLTQTTDIIAISEFHHSQWIEMMTLFRQRQDLARMCRMSSDEASKEAFINDINFLSEKIKKYAILKQI